jgi:hypothetical protein
MSSTPQPEFTTWTIEQFKIHPLQEDFFRWDAGIALKELADDIRRNGLREPIETVEGGVIVAGHRRWRAILTQYTGDACCRSRLHSQ